MPGKTTTETTTASTQHLIPPGGHSSTKSTAQLDTDLSRMIGRPVKTSGAPLLTLTPSHPSNASPAALLHFFFAPSQASVASDSVPMGQDMNGFVKFFTPAEAEYAIRVNFSAIPYLDSTMVLQGPWGTVCAPGIGVPSHPTAVWTAVAAWVGRAGELLSCDFSCSGIIFFHSVQIYRL
jgi:hypothetical protein